MSNFEQEPAVIGEELSPDIVARGSEIGDLLALARIQAARGGRDVHATLTRLRAEHRRISRGEANKHVCVALRGDQVVGFARVAWLPTDRMDGVENLPPGFYLGGAVVDVREQGSGIEKVLTVHRMNWVRGRANELFYIANADNQETINFHGQLGFVEVTRDFVFPGALSRDAGGILLRAHWDGEE